ncbi:MAG: hypothetical protein ACFCU3_08890 [Verrucomicrobiales bacterium]
MKKAKKPTKPAAKAPAKPKAKAAPKAPATTRQTKAQIGKEGKKVIYAVDLSKKDQASIIRLFQGNARTPGLPVAQIVEQFKSAHSNPKRQVMRVLHNEGLKTYSYSSLV